MSLPPLPSPNQRSSATHQNDYGFSKEQMQVYGQQCRAEAIEEAATWLDFYDGEGMRRAEQIRSLK